MDTFAVLIGEILGTDHATSLQIFTGLIVVLLTSLLIIVLIFACRKSGPKAVYITGISDSGKTLLFSQLINEGKTDPITVASQTLNEYDQFLNAKGTSLALIDVPGADKIRTSLLISGLNRFKPAGLIFVIDSGTIQKDCREVAEFFYSILADHPGFFDRRHLPVLVACNKQDSPTCKSSKAVKSMLEKEFNMLNRTRSAALAEVESTSGSKVSGQKRRLLGDSAESDFSFDALPQKFSFIECVSKNNADNFQSNLRPVIDWLNQF